MTTKGWVESSRVEREPELVASPLKDTVAAVRLEADLRGAPASRMAHTSDARPDRPGGAS